MRVESLGCRVQGFGYLVSNFGFRVQGLGLGGSLPLRAAIKARTETLNCSGGMIRCSVKLSAFSDDYVLQVKRLDLPCAQKES